MKAKATTKKMTDEEYYDKKGVLGEIMDEEIAISLDERACKGYHSGKRRRKLQNVTIRSIRLSQSRSRRWHKKGNSYQTAGEATGR